MKIIYAANVRFPSERAHSVQIGHMCQAFSENGHDVTLCVNKRTGASIHEIGDVFGFDPKFQLKRLRPKRIFSRLPFTFVLGEFWYALHVYLYSCNTEFDFVYTRHEWVAWALSWSIDSRKIVWESHEAKYSFPARLALKQGIKVVVISEGINNFYVQNGVPSKQLLVADDAIDDSFFNLQVNKKIVRENLGLPANDFIAMYIGGLSKWKGIETFLQASELQKDVLFVVIGGNRNEIEELQAQFPGVRFLGQRPYRELSVHQQAGDILVIPNTARNALSSSYTSPLKLFAHMSSGVPLVVSDIPSLTSIVPLDMVTTFKPDNPTDLVQQIKEVQKVCGLKKAHAVQLIETAKTFTWKRRAQKIVTFCTGGV